MSVVARVLHSAPGIASVMLSVASSDCKREANYVLRCRHLGRKCVLVSVVIPTRSRPEMLARAVRSVRGQTHEVAEVVVVIDGPCETTEHLLASADLGPLVVVRHSERRGGSVARNSGIRASTSELIALLDDDDEFLPTKIEQQVAVFKDCGAGFSATRFIERGQSGDLVYPRRLPAGDESLPGYLFVRHGLFRGEAELQTSTIMAPRQLFETVPFDERLPRHQDWDWAIRAASVAGLVYLPDALTVRSHTPDKTRVNARHADSWDWARSMRPTMDDRAYSAFLLTVVARAAADERAWSQVPKLLAEAIRAGARPVDLIRFPTFWLLPPQLRERVRHWRQA